MSTKKQPEENKSAQNTPEEHRLDFFRPNQIAFLVTHDVIPGKQLPDMKLKDWVENLGQQMNKDGQLAKTPLKEFAAGLCDQLNNDEQLPATILAEWATHLTPHLDKEGWMLAEDKPIRSYSFPALSEEESRKMPDQYLTEKFNRAFSVIICDVKNLSRPAKKKENNAERTDAKRDLLTLLLKLDKESLNLTSAFPVLTVEGVFPNWIASSSSSNSGGTGGPGGRPDPYKGKTEEVPFYFEDLIRLLEGSDENLPGINIYGEGEDVDVIILDTAPSSQDLVLAHKELVEIPEKMGQKGHPLLKQLLGPAGRLRLYPATYEEHLRMDNTSLNKHGYKMVDHGLFIAGIIHSIVPKATIHLIEVLNQFGVGDLETIAHGLAKAYAISHHNKKGVVINCSLCFDLPDILEQFAYQPTEKEAILDSEKNMEKELRDMLNSIVAALITKYGDKNATDELPWVVALRVMCERLGKAGRQVVAAAGNQGQNAGQSRIAPDARYPAAFTKVVGVGALPIDAERTDGSGKYDASSFSNLADKPAQTGIMALGGEEGPEKGVLGVYLGEFPPDEDSNGRPSNGHGWAKTGPKSDNGWAWWAGTSFATPILTGVIASVLSGPQDPATTQGAIDLLYAECIVVNAVTVKNEDGIPSSLTQVVPSPERWP